MLNKTITITVPIPKVDVNKRSANPLHASGKRKADVNAAKRAVNKVMDELSPEDIDELELPWPCAKIHVRWFHPTKNLKDMWNMVGNLKGTLDGIVRAGILVDDDLVQPPTIDRLVDKDNPRVELDLTPDRAKRFGGLL